MKFNYDYKVKPTSAAAWQKCHVESAPAGRKRQSALSISGLVFHIFLCSHKLLSSPGRYERLALCTEKLYGYFWIIQSAYPIARIHFIIFSRRPDDFPDPGVSGCRPDIHFPPLISNLQFLPEAA